MEVLRHGVMAAAARSIRAAVAFALIAACVLAGSATAHALPLSSDPAAGATVAPAPTAVTITFGERPDPKLSTIKVFDASGTDVSAGPTTVVGSDGLKLTVALPPLPTGVYTVAWRTVAADDGHVASGSFVFGIGVTPPAAAVPGVGVAGADVAGGSIGSTIDSILGRWLLYIGWLGLLGGAAFGLVIARPTGTLYRRLLPVAWYAAAAGSVIVVVTRVADSGASPDAILGSSLGGMILLRGMPLAVAGIGVMVGSRAPRRPALAIVAFGAAAALVADVLLSHAAGSTGPLDVAVQTLHVIAVGLWLGGLAGLLLTIGRRANERTGRAVRRFSWLATIGITTVALTGLLRAIAEIGTVDALLASGFGHLVIAKTGLLAALALLGAANHFRNVPAAGRTLVGLRRIGSAELLVGATVLLLSASLVHIVPPVEVAAAATAPGHAHVVAPVPVGDPIQVIVDGSDPGTSVRVRLAVSPGTVGFDTFHVTVTDYASGGPVRANGVTLRFVYPARSDVDASRLGLTVAGTGVFAATGTNLSLDGSWRIIAVVAHGASSIEVPLELTTRAAERIAAPSRR